VRLSLEQQRVATEPGNRLAAHQLRRVPFCEDCGRRRTTGSATSPTTSGPSISACLNTVFYDRSNLRPSCRRHNLFKGHAENAACDEHDHAPGLPDADLRNHVLAAAIRTAEAVLREHGYREDAMELDQPLTERTHSATKS
jgi:hypothetical protein